MQKYDVAILGAGLGGLTAAALLSSQNKKTIVIEQGASLGNAVGVVEKDGFVFSTGPALSYGFEQGGLFRELSASLGIKQSVSVHTPCYQVALPDHRLTVYANAAETLEEIRREFRREIDRVARFYQDIEGLAKKMADNRVVAFLSRHRSSAGYFSRYGLSKELIAFFDIQSRFFFQKPVTDLSVATLTTLCCTPPLHLDGGFKKFGDELYRIVLQHGGEVLYNESSPSISFHAHGTIGIETGKGMLEAGTVLFNTLPRQRKPMLFVGLLEEVVPLGMSADVLYLPEYSRPQEFMVLSLDCQENSSSVLEGAKALTVSFASYSDTPGEKQARMEQLSTLIPFLSDFIFFADEHDAGAGHAMVPENKAFQPAHARDASSLFYRTATKNAFVLRDTPENPLQAVATVRRNIAKLN